MFKHPENTMALNPKTLGFSALSEFLVGTVQKIVGGHFVRTKAKSRACRSEDAMGVDASDKELRAQRGRSAQPLGRSISRLSKAIKGLPHVFKYNGWPFVA